jgi:ABC-type branched-subunit amino acid transport system substrate-binding protein
MKKGKMLVIFFTLIFLVAATGLFAAGEKEGEEKTPGVTDEEVIVGFSMVMSGPLGFIGSQTVDTIQACFNKHNEQGGIHGRKLTLAAYDSTLDVAQDIANYKKLVGEDEVIAVLFGMWTSVKAVYPIMEKGELAWISPMGPPSSMIFPPNKYLFSVFPTVRTQAAAQAQYIIDQGEWKKVGIIYADNEGGSEAIEDFNYAIEGSSIEVVDAEGIEEGAISATAQVANLRKANPDLVWLAAITMEPAALIVKEIRKIGWDVQIMFDMPITNYTTLSLLSDEEAKGILGGFWAKSYNPNFDDPDSYTPEMKEAAETIIKYYPEAAASIDGYVEHYFTAEMFVEALRRAGENPTRAKIVDALESMDKFPSGKGSYVTFSPTRREGIQGGVIMRAKNNKQWEVITDWIEVDF